MKQTPPVSFTYGSRPFLSGSFYPLTDCDTLTTSCLSYQFDRPDLEGGAVFCFFRQDCAADSVDVTPVLERGRYLFENPETGGSFEKEVGGSFTLTLTADRKPQSVLLIYKKIN